LQPSQQKICERKMKKVNKNPDLLIPISKNNPLKEMIVEYVGTKLQPENDEVTVEMVVDVFSTDFPEFLMPVAEENYIRGYTQALDDVEKTHTGE
jgi:hypothetical protein